MENQIQSVAKTLNKEVGNVISNSALEGFEKAYLIAESVGKLNQMLTPEYMQPIMALQGNKLGFKTDKDTTGGYPEAVVKNCLIEAVLTGVQPFGNQFNIISNNCYITKEGFGYLLKNYVGLSYDIVPSLPRINNDSTSAAIDMNITWAIDGKKNSKVLPVPVKMNKFMGTDAVIGKATRKARAWLYNTITGSEVADGDITEDISYTEIKKPIETADKKEDERILSFIANAKTVAELDQAKDFLTTPEQQDLFNQKMKEVK